MDASIKDEEKQRPALGLIIKDIRVTLNTVICDRNLSALTVSGTLYIALAAIPLIYWQPFTNSFKVLGGVWAVFTRMNIIGSYVSKSSRIKQLNPYRVFRSLIPGFEYLQRLICFGPSFSCQIGACPLWRYGARIFFPCIRINVTIISAPLAK
ncbi:MAG: hypothetical protein HKP58_14665 [Desulfatitalea sp.]|nr:hypothetical protein [Desulfatitalea sp.]NNK01649.1 hypothetical protein [Desulfatitalea sp.]